MTTTMSAPTLTLHIANKNYSSWSLRPWVLMKHLGIPFQEQMHFFAASNTEVASNHAAFRGFSPTGKVPCLQVGSHAVWDSLSIIEFLNERYNGVWPTDGAARAWARSAAAEMHSGFTPLRSTCPMHCGYRVRLNEVSSTLQSDLERLDELWQQGLNNFGGPFLAGSNFTAVDAFFAPVAFRIQGYALELSKPSMHYVQRLLALDSMQAWYQEALLEMSIDPAHDQAALQHGQLLQDLRVKG
jgi:glutathione S-transferase